MSLSVRNSRMATWILAAAVACLAGCDRGDHPGQIGRQAPAFTVADGAQRVDLAQMRGHVVLLNFWASWCAPCLEELPSLNALQRQMPEVKVLGVSTDDDADAYQQFLTRHPVEFLTIRDAAQKSNALYGTFRYPETYVIDKNGVVRRKFIGPQDWTNIEIVDYLRKLAA